MREFVLAVVVVGVMVCVGGLFVRGAGEQNSAPPPGGFGVELVADYAAVRVYRFRDGDRVCYVSAPPNSATQAISCVVSP